MIYTNIHNLPASIVDAIQTETYDLKNPSQTLITISQLINPPIIRQLTLRHYHELQEDISDNVWRLLGSAVHAMLERTENSSRLIEERLNVDLDGITISGKPDLYDYANKTLHDYKVTSVWTLVYKGEEDKQWEYQLNCYAWLYRKLGFEVEKLQIIAILRDWSKRKAAEDRNYPQLPIQVVEIPIWPQEQQENYIQERKQLHLTAQNLSDNDLPICSAQDRWATAVVYAIYKNNNKTATKLFTDKLEADIFLGTKQYEKDKYHIETRKGEDKRCRDYCSVACFCSYGKNVCETCVKKEE